MKNQVYLLGVLGSILLLFANCGASEPRDYSLPEPSADEKFTIKYNGYLESAYVTNKSAREAFEGYSGSGKVEPDANGYARQSISFHSLHERYINEVDELIKSEPVIPKVDDHMASVQVHAKELKAVMDDMKIYEDRGDNELDNYAKGAEYHVLFDKAINSYMQAFELLEVDLEEIQVAQMKKAAEEYKASGQTIRYEMILAMNAATKVVELGVALESGEKADSGLVAMNIALEELIRASDAVYEEAKDPEVAAAQLGRFGKGSLDFWQGYSSDLIRKARKFVEVAKNTELGNGVESSAFRKVGGSNALGIEFNRMVEFYNQTINQPG